ncbi:rod shape-determining protein MreC [Halanaerobium saccharolyticum]|uniref:Cell shape-determining protein MreC n=1 Tax=Halanaerobium saccharolyticum TaxID=43595 RepID=A0A4R7Z5A0_9FIRM|nr:rod shape-determining protein MreC [Halanaerobium saccharolyticum]RAK09364.1 rod shape-determining protein MreC [Halanaerobium saccharolyticum]TDW06223.1 rod shape-determining protein MreC [Halanaerobium saccharolyticum]TDX61017.1 rod shape-determining protein MreC [Halanaerobium saccharolyticum]
MFEFNRNTLIAAAIVLLLVLIIGFIYFIDINIPFVNWLSDLIYNTITPILNIIQHLVENIKNFFTTLFSIDDINQEIEDLRQENSVLERQILFLENINRENKRLRELLNFKEKVDYQMLGAEVIANSPSIWEKVITINRGSQNGLAERMPVITYQGYLVGRIESLGRNSAQVRLIIDQDFVVGGIIARTESREIGLVRGSGRDDQANIMDNIAWDADIKTGDVVLTSGLSNNFPAGLKIGEVVEVETDNYGLSQKAAVNLFINNITLEEVMVIKNFEPEVDEELNEENMTEINTNEESEEDDSNPESEDN